MNTQHIKRLVPANQGGIRLKETEIRKKAFTITAINKSEYLNHNIKESK